MTMNSNKIAVTMKRRYKNIQSGEVCGFEPGESHELVKQGYASYYREEDNPMYVGSKKNKKDKPSGSRRPKERNRMVDTGGAAPEGAVTK